MRKKLKNFEKIKIKSVHKFEMLMDEEGCNKITLTLELSEFVPKKQEYYESDFILYINNK